MRWRRALVPAVALAVAGATLTACGNDSVARIRYVVDGDLHTYNAATVAASAAPRAFARTLGGFGYHGPDGQVVADNDFGAISVVRQAPLVLDYQIADKAVYSDDKPVTCDDMVLAWAAQSGRYPQFDAASQAGYSDIAAIDCRPGEKKARVSFAQDRAFVDYKQLFAATALMPSHVIAGQLGIADGAVTDALMNADAAQVDRIAQAWNTIWTLTAEADLTHFPSSGPFKIDSVHDDGTVELVANDHWWGAAPVARRITVSPQRGDLAEQVRDGGVDVVDVAAGSAGALNASDDYQRTEYQSADVQQLIFAPEGPLSQVPTRRALALCTPRDVIAGDAGVPIINTRLFTAIDDAYDDTENTGEAGPFAASDPDAARAELDAKPLSVRIGYREFDARLAAIVETITRACEPAGIEVVGAPGTGPQALSDGQIDVLLAGTGGNVGSTGSSVMDAYTLRTGNGDNLARYNNGQIDGIISALAVTVDPAEVSRLLAESAPVLWADLPTLPLYRQQRTLLTSKKVTAVAANPTRWGAGWNMDRWGQQR